MEKIIHNRIRCKLCDDIIESETRHDFKYCKCGACGVDGGHFYLKRVWDPEKGEKDDIIEEMNEVEFELRDVELA